MRSFRRLRASCKVGERLWFEVLRAARQHLVPGRIAPTFPRDVPTRFRNWADLYGLSVDILDGYGIDYVNQSDVMSPGFVVRTSDAWEEFLRQALVAGLSDCRVSFQEKHPFAKRDKSTVRVRPDYVVRGANGGTLLVDAKYKYGDARSGTISNSDIYEGWHS
ncbi:MAG: 5-methylcytosine restriction system specificity protein McrC [Collinsella sp.]